MAQVVVKIGGLSYPVGCEDGQEQHLQTMAAEVDKRVELVRPVAGQGAEGRLLVLAALMLADEVHDLGLLAAQKSPPREIIKEVIREVPVVKEVIREVRVEVPVEVPVQVPVADSVFAHKLASIADRAEEIAAGLERA
jgi:cell division protein ZapA (FtsZ GTPase activity inhibitor)